MKKHLRVTKDLYNSASLGSLCASLKSSKKPYVAYSDKSIPNRAIIGMVAIDEEVLEKLEKVSKPLWWNQLQKVKDQVKDYQKEFEGLEVFQFGFLSSGDAQTGQKLLELEREFGVDSGEFRLVQQPNGYCTLTKKF